MSFTSAADIMAAVDQGEPVKWSNGGYDVIKDSVGQYLVICSHNGHCIGLTWRDGVTLNGDVEDFYIAPNGGS